MGLLLDPALILINPSLDSYTLSLYKFYFTVGSRDIAAGYDQPYSNFYS